MLHSGGNGNSGKAGSAAAAACSFSILFPVSDNDEVVDGGGDQGGMVSSSSVVDCTLSLGTPYTRHLSSASSSPMQHSSSSSSSSLSSLCWDILPQPTKQASSAAGVGGDPFLLARRCANCDTTSTPLWRNGPRGPKSLCNACGIRYKKEERRAAVSSTAMAVPAVAERISYGYTRGQPPPHPWSCYTPAVAAAKSSAVSVYAGDPEEQRELYLPWRLNVVPQYFPAVGDRSSLSQYQ